MTVTAHLDFINRIESLPPLPTIARQIQAITQAPNASASDVARVVGSDPAIASKVLRVANSPFYGVRGEVTQVSRAVVILGERTICNLVLGLCAHNSLVPSTGKAPEHTTLWIHSVAVATACDLVARQVGFSPPEESFLAGLLHDAGKLAMVTFDPALFRQAARERLPGDLSLKAERERFGMDHAEAGFQILTRWGLPESFCQVARLHHTPQTALHGDADRLVAMTLFANRLVRIAGYGLDMPFDGLQVGRAAAQRLGLSESDQAFICTRLDQRVKEAAEALSGRGIGEFVFPRLPGVSRVIWVTPGGQGHSDICPTWLQSRGYEVRQVARVDVGGGWSPEDLFVIDPDPATEAEGRDTVAALSDLGLCKTVLLCGLEENLPHRRRNPVTGVYYVPQVFTTYDLKWLAEKMAS